MNKEVKDIISELQLLETAIEYIQHKAGKLLLTCRRAREKMEGVSTPSIIDIERQKGLEQIAHDAVIRHRNRLNKRNNKP